MHATLRYFVQIMLDTTLVVFLNFVVLRHVEHVILSRYGVDVASGNYGDPPEWRRFVQQLLVWLYVVVVCKVMTTMLEYLLEEPLAAFGLLILSPLCFNPHLELFIVVVLLPLILNAFQFWVVDSYLMSKDVLLEKEEGGRKGLPHVSNYMALPASLGQLVGTVQDKGRGLSANFFEKYGAI